MTRTLQTRLWRLIATLAALPLAWTASAEDPGPFVPTYAFVLEGSAIDVPLRDGLEPGTLDGLGMAVQKRLDLAWSERRDGELRLVFRVAGETSAELRGFSVQASDGTERPAPIGVITVVPAPTRSDLGVAVTGVIHDGSGALLWSVRLEHRGDRPQRLRTLEFAPSEVALGPVVVRHLNAGSEVPDLFEWVAELRPRLASAVPNARALAPAETEAALRRLLPAEQFRDPASLDLELAPGEVVDLLITRANVDVDLTTARLIAEPLLRGDDPTSGGWTVSLGGPWQAGVDR